MIRWHVGPDNFWGSLCDRSIDGSPASFGFLNDRFTLSGCTDPIHVPQMGTPTQ